MRQADPPADSNARRENTAATSPADPNRNVRTINPYPNATSSPERPATAADTSPDAQPSNSASPAAGAERSDAPDAATSDTTPNPKPDNGTTPKEKSKEEQAKEAEEKARKFISDGGLEDGYVNVVVVFKRNYERATYRMTRDEAQRLANDFVASQKPTESDASTLAGVYEARYVNRTPCFLAVRLSDVWYIG